MRGFASKLVVALLLAACVATTANGQETWAPRTDGDVKDWYQRRGNSARSGVSTFAPVRLAPQETWRVELPGQVVSNLVTWDGVVFVVVKKDDKAVLHAYQVADGKRAGLRRLPGKTRGVELAVWNGTVVVQQSDVVTLHGYRAGKFRLPWTWEGSFTDLPLVTGTALYLVRDSRLLHCKKTRTLTGTPREECSGWSSVQSVLGRPQLVSPHIGPLAGYRGKYLYVDGQRALLIELAQPKPDLPKLSVHRIEDDRGSGGWLIVGQVAVQAESGRAFGIFRRDHAKTFNVYDIRSEVVVLEGRAYGWTGKGELISVTLSGYRVLLEKSGRPEGFAGRRLSAARKVLYLGNAAVEMDGGRVLWCAKHLDPTSPMIPAGDGRIVVLDRGGTLVGLAEPSSSGSRGNGTAGGAPSPGERSDVALVTALQAPRTGDGVLLRDGRQVLGAVTLTDGGGVRVTPPEGDPKDFAEGDVAAAISEGRAVGPRSEYHCHRIWRAVLRAECAAAFATLARRCVGERLLTEARRVTERAREYGLSVEEIAKLGSRATGLTESPNAQRKSIRLRADEVEIDRGLGKRFVAGSDWLAKRGLNRAAAALLADVAPLCHGDPAWSIRAEALAPPAFVVPSRLDRGEQWARWARALLPSNATVLTRDAKELRRFRGSEWAGPGVMAFATADLLLLSRSHDAEVVGACLQRGETAVHTLEALLYEGQAPPAAEPLVVLLHDSRKSYLAEKTPLGSAPPWSAGYYSPAERLSRFFVPTAQESADPLGRSLYSTLAHELTHHWVDRRWSGGGRSGQETYGYWAVEGIAQFVGDQAADSEPHQVVLNNPRVTSLDAMAQATAQGTSLPLTQFIDLTGSGFARLSGKPAVTVQLRNTLSGRVLSERALFYEQAAALTWFMMNRRGPDGRERFRRYLWAYYHNGTPTGGWASLGFESREQLAALFSEFLTELAGKPAKIRTGPPIAAGPKELPPARPHVAGSVRPPRAETPPVGGTKTAYEIDDDVLVLYRGKYREGVVTGRKGDKYWILVVQRTGTKTLLVGADELRPR